MRKRLGIAVLLVALSALILAAVPGAAPAQTTLNSYEKQLVQRVNKVRAAHHLAPLVVRASLVRSARVHSADMGARQYFAHNDPDGVTWVARILRSGYTRTGYRVWKVGENIQWAEGLMASPVLVVDAWMRSPMHRAVILTTAFRDIGVGAVQAADGGGQTADGRSAWFFTLDLGRRIQS